MKAQACPIRIVHSDLPTNDLSQLFLALGTGGRTAHGGGDVYAGVVGGSMFDRLLPPCGLPVATTFNAVGFPGRRPLDRLEGYILPNGGSAIRGRGAVSEADRAACAAQAARDMEAFLRARAEELVPGGRLLVQAFVGNDTARTRDGIFDLLNDAILRLVAAGRIDRETYDRYCQPGYFRTLDELAAPLIGRGAPLAGD